MSGPLPPHSLTLFGPTEDLSGQKGLLAPRSQRLPVLPRRVEIRRKALRRVSSLTGRRYESDGGDAARTEDAPEGG